MPEKWRNIADEGSRRNFKKIDVPSKFVSPRDVEILFKLCA